MEDLIQWVAPPARSEMDALLMPTTLPSQLGNPAPAPTNHRHSEPTETLETPIRAWS